MSGVVGVSGTAGGPGVSMVETTNEGLVREEEGVVAMAELT